MSVFDELSALFSSGRFSDTEKLALALVKANPSDEHERYALAQAVNRQGRVLDAIKLMESLIQNPQLKASQALYNHWGDKIRTQIENTGSKRLLYDKLRSMPLEQLAPLFTIPGITWISLQKGHDAADCLDLIISVDTSVAHLAGAMNKPVWLLNCFDTDWRWQLGRTDSPWYPSMTIFRQPALGNWDDVIIQVAKPASFPESCSCSGQQLLK